MALEFPGTYVSFSEGSTAAVSRAPAQVLSADKEAPGWSLGQLLHY